MSPSGHTLTKAIDISKKLHEIQELDMRQRLYKYCGQWTAIDLHKNHWLKKQIDELIVVCIFQYIQAKN